MPSRSNCWKTPLRPSWPRAKWSSLTSTATARTIQESFQCVSK
jgi:hypothetical protein